MFFPSSSCLDTLELRPFSLENVLVSTKRRPYPLVASPLWWWMVLWWIHISGLPGQEMRLVFVGGCCTLWYFESDVPGARDDVCIVPILNEELFEERQNPQNHRVVLFLMHLFWGFFGLPTVINEMIWCPYQWPWKIGFTVFFWCCFQGSLDLLTTQFYPFWVKFWGIKQCSRCMVNLRDFP